MTAIVGGSALGALASLAALGISGCEPATALTAPSTAPLPRWDQRAAQFFDDAIDPAALGLALDGPSPRSDGFFRERCQTADLVARVKVRTVTLDSHGAVEAYHLGLQIGQPPLAGGSIADQVVDVTIKSSSPGFSTAHAMDARLQGMVFVGFLKRYAGEDGEVALHWHLAPNTAEVLDAVKEAVVLGEISPFHGSSPATTPGPAPGPPTGR